MKTLKLVLIAALISTALVNNAFATEVRPQSGKNVIQLTFLEAIQSPGLVAAMHSQLSGGFLGGPALTKITLRVIYNNHTYMITGTQDQWNLFFNCGGITLQPLTTKGRLTSEIINN